MTTAPASQSDLSARQRDVLGRIHAVPGTTVEPSCYRWLRAMREDVESAERALRDLDNARKRTRIHDSAAWLWRAYVAQHNTAQRRSATAAISDSPTENSTEGEK